MAPASVLLSLDNAVLRSYVLCSCILILKMLIMGPITGINRMKYKAFANSEDAKILKVAPKVDEHVERVRRAHLNDVENIPLFFVSAMIYTLTNPRPTTATILFVVYTVSRFLHSFVFAIVPLPQPARSLSYLVALGITIYMTVTGMIYFIRY